MSKQMKLLHVRMLAERVAGTIKEPTWEFLSDIHKCSDGDKGATHEGCALFLRLLLDKERKDNETLRQRMEDLCLEMERAKTKQVILMGPGTDGKNETHEEQRAESIDEAADIRAHLKI